MTGEEPRFRIERMNSKHVSEICEIHITELGEDFSSLLGRNFLKKVFYPYFQRQPNSVGFVALEQGLVVGFVIAQRAKGYYISFIKNNFFGLVCYGFLAFTRSPQVVFCVWDICRLIVSAKAFQPDCEDAELLYIAVSKDNQGHAVGSLLVSRLVDSLKLQSLNRCIVKTLVSTPATVSFYEKNSFEQFKTAFGRVWLTLPLSPRKTNLVD